MNTHRSSTPEPPRSIAEVLAESRRGIDRVAPADLPALQKDGAHVIDIRSVAHRDAEGHIPGATVIDRLVLEWRLDPTSPDRMDDAPAAEDLIVVVCDEGYASSLAARDLRQLGLTATDLDGGFRAWAAAGLPTEGEPSHQVA